MMCSLEHKTLYLNAINEIGVTADSNTFFVNNSLIHITLYQLQEPSCFVPRRLSNAYMIPT